MYSCTSGATQGLFWGSPLHCWIVCMPKAVSCTVLLLKSLINTCTSGETNIQPCKCTFPIQFFTLYPSLQPPFPANTSSYATGGRLYQPSAELNCSSVRRLLAVARSLFKSVLWLTYCAATASKTHVLHVHCACSLQVPYTKQVIYVCYMNDKLNCVCIAILKHMHFIWNVSACTGTFGLISKNVPSALWLF